jgi:hypothetical protein
MYFIWIVCPEAKVLPLASVTSLTFAHCEPVWPAETRVPVPPEADQTPVKGLVPPTMFV